MSDKFSSLDENSDNLLKDKNYSWDLLTNTDNNIENNDFDIASSALNPKSSGDKNDKKLPSLEELLNKKKSRYYLNYIKNSKKYNIERN